MLKFASTSILSSQFLCSASTYRANSIHLVDLCMLNTTSTLQTCTKNEQHPQQSNVHRCYYFHCYFHSCIYYIYLRERADTPNPQYSTSPGTFSPSQREICSTFTFTEIYAFSLSHFHFSRYFSFNKKDVNCWFIKLYLCSIKHGCSTEARDIIQEKRYIAIGSWSYIEISLREQYSQIHVLILFNAKNPTFEACSLPPV